MTPDPFLQAAIDQAEAGLAEGGIPIGSVIVHSGEIIGRGHNRRVQRGSVVLHGEMDALENAGRRSAAVYRECVLYTTLSPCPMCTGAILLYGIPRVIVGENQTFMGDEELLRGRGVIVDVRQDPRCIALMRQFIADRPELWNEDIGIEQGNIMRRILIASVIALVLVGSLRSVNCEAQSPEVPKEVRDMAGTYTGEWTMYGIDEKGNVVKKYDFTDKGLAENPEVKDGRAYVTVTDEMNFGSKAQPMKFVAKEGYYLLKGGMLGDMFVESRGEVHRMVWITEGVTSYAMEASSQELQLYGFPSGASGQHVVVKTNKKESGVETHRICRITNAHWKDAEGKDRWIQFVSLKGQHKKDK